jgi:hypothetical protein
MRYHDDTQSDHAGRYPTDQLSVADRLDASRFFGLPETAGEVVVEVMRRVDAASALVYAMHDAGPEFLSSMPADVRHAYDQCCAAYRPNFP